MAKKVKEKPMAEANYDDILERSWDEIPQEKILPLGSYLLAGKNAAYKGPTETSNAKVLFFYNVKEPTDDVDVDQLSELGDDYDIGVNQVVYTIWIEGPRDWDAVRRHLEMHGVETKGKSQKETFAEFRGAPVIAYLDQRTYTARNGEMRTENNPTNFTPVG